MLTWEKFRSVPRRYLKKGEPLRVSYGREGSWGWMEIRYYPKRKRSKPGRITGNCSFCGFVYRVRYIIPYDLRMPPGLYCRKCREKYSLIDIKDAQRYNKIL